VLIDTCGWIEWLTAGSLAKKYEPFLSEIETVLVPTSVQFELYKWVKRKHNMQKALEVIALTEQATVMPLTTGIALSAADFATQYKLSFADAIIYATAQFHDAELITSDDHFENLPDVTFFRKKPG